MLGVEPVHGAGLGDDAHFSAEGRKILGDESLHSAGIE